MWLEISGFEKGFPVISTVSFRHMSESDLTQQDPFYKADLICID